MKLEASPFPIIILFFHCCVPEVVHIEFQISRILFPLLLCSVCCVQISGYNMAWRSYSSSYHILIIIMQLIWKLWIYLLLVWYIIVGVCLRLCPFSQSSIMQYVGYCVVSFCISLLMILRIFVLHITIIIRSEIWIISHCLGLCYETIVCALCPAMFLGSAFYL